MALDFLWRGMTPLRAALYTVAAVATLAILAGDAPDETNHEGSLFGATSRDSDERREDEWWRQHGTRWPRM